MPQIEQQVKSARRTVILITVGVGVVVLAAGAYLAYRLFPSPATTISQAGALSNQGKYGAAYEKLKEAYPRAIFANDKTKLLYQMAAAANNSRDYKASLGYYQQLNAQNPNTYSILVSMGDEAYQLGQKSQAANYYRQALTLLNSGQQKPESAHSAYDLQQRIDQLESDK